jgi:hypothetical protein
MKSRRSTSDLDHYAREAITQLLGLQLRAGMSETSLRRLAADCVASALRASLGPEVQKGLGLHRLGSVLRAWHKETRYLTREGLPRSLPIDGKFGLRSLIATQYPRQKFKAVFAKLEQTGLIEKAEGERWVPTAKHARISELTQETLAHLSEGVARFVETVTQNISSESKDDLLFERSCKVTKLPKSEATAFREFVRQQAFTFLIAVDDWLESKVVKSGAIPRKTCTAGVFTFAYLGDDTKEQSRKRGQ